MSGQFPFQSYSEEELFQCLHASEASGPCSFKTNLSIESGTGTLIAKCKAVIVFSVFHFNLNMGFWKTVLFNLLTQSSNTPRYHESYVILITTILLHQSSYHFYTYYYCLFI